MNKTILITGADGQLGQELQLLSKSYTHNFIFSNRNTLDITDSNKLDLFFEQNKIDVIINCAAYTSVDMAEKNQEIAYSVNYYAVKKLAQIAQKYSIKLIHISTDYVFDGKNFEPYTEEDIPKPCGVYGTSKYLGEQSIININPQNSIIIRTAWVYSYFGSNFVKSILRLARDKDFLNVIYDQVGTPTYAKDLAKLLLEISPKINNEKVEIFHYSNEGVLSWYDFAKEIVTMAKLKCIINPIESKDYITFATRPYYTLLNKKKIKSTFDIEIPYWKDSLEECLKKLGERK